MTSTFHEYRLNSVNQLTSLNVEEAIAWDIIM